MNDYGERATNRHGNVRNEAQDAPATAGTVLTRWWDAERTLLLVSPNLFALLPDGVVLKSINGKRLTKGKDPIDDDTRAGVMAFGFEMSPPTDGALREEVNVARTAAAHASDATLAMEMLHRRLDEAHVFAQETSEKDAKHWGENVWHVALDEAKRLRAEVERLGARCTVFENGWNAEKARADKAEGEVERERLIRVKTALNAERLTHELKGMKRELGLDGVARLAREKLTKARVAALEAIIKDAPHALTCHAGYCTKPNHPPDDFASWHTGGRKELREGICNTEAPCDCWKRAALARPRDEEGK